MSERTRKFLLDLLIGIAVGAVAIVLIRKTFFLLFPIALAFLFSELIRKSFRRLRPLNPIAKRILIVLILLIFFALLFLIALILAERAIRTSSEMAEWLTGEFDHIIAFCRGTVTRLEATAGRLLGREMTGSILSQLPVLLEKLLESLALKLPQWIARLVGFFPRFLLSLFIFLISCYYFSCDADRFAGTIQKYVSEEKLAFLSRTKKRFCRALGQFTRAYLILYLLVFAMLFLGLILLRVSNAVGLAATIALVDALPVLGTGTVLIPWALIAFLTGESARAGGLLLLYAIILVTRQILEPKIVGDAIGLHPIISLLLVISGLSFFGLAGMILLPLGGVCIAKALEEENKG